MSRISPENPMRKTLIRLMHNIEEDLLMDRNDIMLILLELDTEEKIYRFYQWIKTRLNGEQLMAQPREVVRAACDISDILEGRPLIGEPLIEKIGDIQS